MDVFGHVSNLVLRGRRALQHVSSGVSGLAVFMGQAAKPFVASCVKMSKVEEMSHEMHVLTLQHVLSGVSGFAVFMGEAAKPFVVQCVKVSKLEEVSHEMLFLMLQSTIQH